MSEGVPVFHLTYKEETSRDPADPFTCVKVEENVEYEINHETVEKLKDMVLVMDDEGSEACNRGTLFSNCSFRYVPVLKDKEGRYWYLSFDESRINNVHSNAVEVCGEHGCSLVPACPTGTYQYSLSVVLEPVPEEDLKYIEEDAETYPAGKILYDYVEDAVNQWVRGDEYVVTDKTDEKLKHLLNELWRLVAPAN